MDSTTLTRGDLICLLNKSEAALQEAIQKVRPYLKPNLTEQELLHLRRHLVRFRAKFQEKLRGTSGSHKEFQVKYGTWLESRVNLPVDLISDSSAKDSGVLSKCGNCQKVLTNISDSGPSNDKQKETFEVVFEAYLKQNNLNVSK